MELHGLYQTKREAVEGGKKGGPSEGSRQHSAVCFLHFIMAEAGAETAVVGS